MITPTCTELELCCKNPPHFLKLMRTKYSCVCALCIIFIVSALSAAPLSFLIADYVQYGDIDYVITSPIIISDNHNHSLSNSYYCTYNKMIIECSMSSTSSPNICWFLNTTTYKTINNDSSISIDRSLHNKDYDIHRENNKLCTYEKYCATLF